MNKIIADRAMGILVVTGIRSSPCPSGNLKPTLDSISPKEMQFGPEEQLFIDAQVKSMPAPGQAWSTKALLIDGSECQPTGDEAFLRRVEAVQMRVMFEEGSDPTEIVDVLTHSEIDRVVPTCGCVCMTEWMLEKSEPRPTHPIGGTTGSW